MPLNTTKLDSDLNSAFKELEKPLKKSLNEHFSSPTLGPKSLYEAQKKIDDWVRANSAISGFDVESYKRRVWTEVAKQWAESLSEHISKDITAVLSSTVSPLISSAIDSYIRTATVSVTIPPLIYSQGAGVSTIPAPSPVLVSGDPTGTPVTNLGGIS
jgi:hypothetical protein